MPLSQCTVSDSAPQMFKKDEIRAWLIKKIASQFERTLSRSGIGGTSRKSPQLQGMLSMNLRMNKGTTSYADRRTTPNSNPLNVLGSGEEPVARKSSLRWLISWSSSTMLLTVLPKRRQRIDQESREVEDKYWREDAQSDRGQ